MHNNNYIYMIIYNAKIFSLTISVKLIYNYNVYKNKICLQF